jgi:hypothetical protein
VSLHGALFFVSFFAFEISCGRKYSAGSNVFLFLKICNQTRSFVDKTKFFMIKTKCLAATVLIVVDVARHAQDVRELYERKLERANNLYMELSACMLQLEKREKELLK